MTDEPCTKWPNVLAIVPARSGSKGIEHKNILSVAGKSLIEHAVCVASAAQSVAEVHISTDSLAYAQLAMAAGAKFTHLRPANLSGDDVRTVDVVIDLLNKLQSTPEIVLLIQPTSPLRTPKDIDNCVRMLLDEEALDSVVSVSDVVEPHPYKVQQLDELGYLRPFMRRGDYASDQPRQVLPAVCAPNGAIYAIKTNALKSFKTFLPERTRPYVMQLSLNIDQPWDFETLDALWRTNKISIFGGAKFAM